MVILTLWMDKEISMYVLLRILLESTAETFHQAHEGNVTIINTKKVKNNSEKYNHNPISFTFIINFL